MSVTVGPWSKYQGTHLFLVIICDASGMEEMGTDAPFLLWTILNSVRIHKICSFLQEKQEIQVESLISKSRVISTVFTFTVFTCTVFTYKMLLQIWTA